MPILEFHLDERSPLERTLRLAKNSRLPDLVIQVLDEGSSISLANATATFSMIDSTGAVKVSSTVAKITDAGEGILEYNWAAADVDTEGRFTGQFTITQGGKDFRVPNNDTQKLFVIIGSRVN